jgi:hypothetical protein
LATELVDEYYLRKIRELVVPAENKPRHTNELDVPPQALSDARAVEIARIWAAGGNQIVAFRAETWSDPATWGIMLVDFVKHIADAYEELGKGSRNDILTTIRRAFDAEWRTPTDHQTEKQ